MTDLRVRRIEIKAFKAFQDFGIDLNGRDLLVYGANGSGKSSLYWALYTFLQSAQKETEAVAKYFDAALPENLLNLQSKEQAQAAITITLQNYDASDCPPFTISKDKHDTKLIPNIVKSNLASDFISYRVLFSFYHFRHSQSIDLWPVFEREMLPFCQTPSLADVAAHWRQIREEKPFEDAQTAHERGSVVANRYNLFDGKVAKLNTALHEILERITVEAQAFYNKHFVEPGDPKLELKLGLTAEASLFDRKKHVHTPPAIGFEVKIDGNAIHKPHSFLNEAKLTQLSISIRFGATLSQLQESPLKLLVLDDILISLDMSNRMKVVDIILGDTFSDYQKVILTHDLGLFREFRRRIGTKHPSWSFLRFKGTPATHIDPEEDKTDLEKAESYLHGQNLDEAAVCLRKAADDMGTRYQEWMEKKKLPPGEFFTLSENLRAARKKLLERIPRKFYEHFVESTPEAHRKLLIPQTDADLDHVAGLTPVERGKLKSQRTSLRNWLEDKHWKDMENVKIIDQILEAAARVLNPGAHGGESPLYEAEIQSALDLLKKLELCLP